MWHAYGNANGYAHIHADSDCDGNRHIHSNSDCDGNGHIHADSDRDGNGHIHADSDSNSDIYSNRYGHGNGNGYSYSYSYGKRIAAAYTDGTASSDPGAATVKLCGLFISLGTRERTSRVLGYGRRASVKDAIRFTKSPPIR
jgi:hypothetical protein